MIVAVVSCCVFPTIPDTRIALYSVEIGYTQRDQYVKWKDDGTDFDKRWHRFVAVKAGTIASMLLRIGDTPYQYR